MITKEKLINQAGLRKIDIISELQYFLIDNIPCDSAIIMVWSDLKQLWIDKKYLSFLFGFGPSFEYIIYKSVINVQIEIYQIYNKELPHQNGFYQFEIRSTKSGIKDIIECLASPLKKQRFTLESFNQKKWTSLECFKFKCHQTLDEWTMNYLIQLLKELNTLRDSFAHGNIKQFVQSELNEYSFPNVASFDLGGNIIENLTIPFPSAPDAMIFLNISKNEEFKLKIKKIFIHLSYILTEVNK